MEVIGATSEELLDDTGNVELGKVLGLKLEGHWVSSDAEWDGFEDSYLEGVESYAREAPDDPDVPEMLRRIQRWREGYLRWGKQTLGFGVYIFRTEVTAPSIRTETDARRTS